MCSLYDEQVVDKKKRFHAEHVFNHPNLGGKKIGLWIDLTKTDRYYSDSEVRALILKFDDELDWIWHLFGS